MNKAILDQAVALVRILEQEVKSNHHLVADKPGFEELKYVPVAQVGGPSYLRPYAGGMGLQELQAIAEHNGDLGVLAYIKLREAASSARHAMNRIAETMAAGEAAHVFGEGMSVVESKRHSRRTAA